MTARAAPKGRRIAMLGVTALAGVLLVLVLVPSALAQPVVSCQGLSPADCEQAADAVLAAVAERGRGEAAELHVVLPAYCTFTMGGPAHCLSGDAVVSVGLRDGSSVRYRVYLATTWYGLRSPARAVLVPG